MMNKHIEHMNLLFFLLIIIISPVECVEFHPFRSKSSNLTVCSIPYRMFQYVCNQICLILGFFSSFSLEKRKEESRAHFSITITSLRDHIQVCQNNELWAKVFFSQTIIIQLNIKMTINVISERIKNISKQLTAKKKYSQAIDSLKTRIKNKEKSELQHACNHHQLSFNSSTDTESNDVDCVCAN